MANAAMAAAAAPGMSLSLPPGVLGRGLLTVAIIAIATLAITLGTYIAAGALVGKVQVVGGVALWGFQTLLGMPIMVLTALLVGVLLGVGSKLVGKPVSATTKGVVSVITTIGALFLLIFVAQLICSRISSLPKFSYTDALKVFGHTMWIALAGIGLLGCTAYCCARK